MIGFPLPWPTIPSLVMFPILVVVYAPLAAAEERAVAARFGDAWREYAAHTPAFLPRLRGPRSSGAPARPSETAERPR